MGKVIRFPESHRKHPILSSEKERRERMMEQAQQENAAFYEEANRIANDVTFLRTGVNEKVAHQLTLNQPGGMADLRQRTIEEKVQMHLYREVYGNEIPENDGPDIRNYQDSLTVEHLNQNLPVRSGRNFVKVMRGVGSMVGANTYVEAAVDRRFGADRNLLARRQFVTNRLQVQLNMIFTGAPVLLQNMVAFMNGNLGTALALNAPPPVIANTLATFSFLTLRRLEQWCVANGLPNLVNAQAFRDLRLLIYVEQKESSKFGADMIYDTDRLRQFWDTDVPGAPTLANTMVIPPGGGAPQPFTNLLVEVLEPHSLFPLEENNPEGVALLAELRNRLANRAAMTNLAAGAIPPQVYQDVWNEVQQIMAAETPPTQRTQEQLDAVRNLQTETRRLVNGIRQNISISQNGRMQQLTLQAQINNIENTINGVGGPIPNPNQIAQLRTVQDSKQTALNALITKISDAENVIRTNASDLANLMTANGINDIAATFGFPPNLDPITIARNTADYTAAIAAAANFLTQLNQNFSNLENQVQQRGNDLIPIPRARLTPFELLKRLLRRDHMRERHIPVNQFNEEADRYALIKTVLRVEDVESRNRKRTANAQAAEIANRGIIARGYDKFKYMIAKGQDLIGLEMIDFKEITGDKFLEGLVKSNDQYTPFTGINKFTTRRDIKQMMNNAGRPVSRQTLERFAQTLEEAISQFKEVSPELRKDLDPDDWDLENLIEAFKQVKTEMWVGEFLDRVEAAGGPGEREHNLIRLLRESRRQEKQLDNTIRAQVKHKDAIWRVQFAKKALKRVLDKDALDGMNKIKQAGLERKRQEIAGLEASMNALPANDPGREAYASQIADLRADITAIERQIRDASDLHDRVEKARQYIRENKLSRKEKKEYLQSVGLAQVFDKMSTNFRLQNGWGHTKRGARAFWSGTKKSWAWSRRNFLNAAKARSAASKSFSVGRLLATPVTAPLGWAWKGGTFPVRLVGRALRRSTHMPKRMVGMFSKSTLRGYYRDRIEELNEEIFDIGVDIGKLRRKQMNVPYKWDRKRLARKINKLIEQQMDLNQKVAEYNAAAAKNKVDIGTIVSSQLPANDNAEAPVSKKAA